MRLFVDVNLGALVAFDPRRAARSQDANERSARPPACSAGAYCVARAPPAWNVERAVVGQREPPYRAVGLPLSDPRTVRHPRAGRPAFSDNPEQPPCARAPGSILEAKR